MVDEVHTLRPTDRALWELPLPAGQVVLVEVKQRAAFGYQVELINLSLTDPIYYASGTTVELRGRTAQVVLPGNRNVEAVSEGGTVLAFVSAVDAKISIARQ